MQFKALIAELKKRELPQELVSSINNEIEQLNSVVSEKTLKKQLKSSQSRILKSLEKDIKLVPKNHYRNTWMVLGMTTIGVPLGVAFGTSLDNMAFLGIGIPIGMVIGLAIGSELDKKAYNEGRQLDIEIKG